MSNRKESFWIPYADLMTVLMLIFLFIALAYISLLQVQQKEKDLLVKDFKETKQAIYDDLDSVFKNDFQKWDIELDKDLSIKFTNPKFLFESNSSEINPKFQAILIEFLPKYLSVLTKQNYKNKIAEVRIEGHTDTLPVREGNDPYIDNIKLSQDRSRAVLQFFRSIPSYKTLSDTVEKRLQFWLTANGLSYGRTLDANKNLTHDTGLPPDNNTSRRVEFRIITSSEKVVEDISKQLKEE